MICTYNKLALLTSLLLLLLVSSCKDDVPPTFNESVIDELKQVVHPIEATPLTIPDEDLQVLDNLFADSQIVGLGEATHGTSEFFSMKDRLFRYLVQNHGYRIFAFEADMGESIFLNNYVQTGEGDLRELMSNFMHFWTWRNDEVFDLLEWMKNYNKGKAPEEKLHYVGVDAQFLTYQHELLRTYLNAHNPELYQKHKESLISTEGLQRDDFQGMSTNEFEALISSINDFRRDFMEAESDLISGSSEFDYELNKRLLENISQTMTVLFNGFNDTSFNYRDDFMGENTLWARNLLGTPSKVAYWGHNFHVANLSSSGSAGSVIHREIQDEYVIIGYTFNEGNFTGFDNISAVRTLNMQTPIDGTINSIFNELVAENFIFVIEDANAHENLSTWVNRNNRMLEIGCCYSPENNFYIIPVNLSTKYDVIIHFNESNPSGIFQ